MSHDEQGARRRQLYARDVMWSLTPEEVNHNPDLQGDEFSACWTPDLLRGPCRALLGSASPKRLAIAYSPIETGLSGGCALKGNLPLAIVHCAFLTDVMRTERSFHPALASPSAMPTKGLSPRFGCPSFATHPAAFFDSPRHTEFEQIIHIHVVVSSSESQRPR